MNPTCECRGKKKGEEEQQRRRHNTAEKIYQENFLEIGFGRWLLKIENLNFFLT